MLPEDHFRRSKITCNQDLLGRLLLNMCTYNSKIHHTCCHCLVVGLSFIGRRRHVVGHGGVAANYTLLRKVSACPQPANIQTQCVLPCTLPKRYPSWCCHFRQGPRLWCEVLLPGETTLTSKMKQELYELKDTKPHTRVGRKDEDGDGFR